MHASVTPLAMALLASIPPLAGAHAGLIGDTVTFDGQSAVINSDGPEFDIVDSHSGFHTIIDFTNDSLTITRVVLPGDGPLPISSDSDYDFIFTSSTIENVQYVSGTVPEFIPITLPPDFSGTTSYSYPYPSGAGAAIFPHELFIVTASPPALSLTYNVTAIDSLPEPASLGLFASPLVLLIIRQAGRRTVNQGSRATLMAP